MRRKNDDERRTIIAHCRLSQNEMKILEDKVEKTGLTVSEFMRRLILNKQIKYRPPTIYDVSGLIEAMGVVSKEASNLNQIARYCNEDKYVDPKLEGYLKQAANDIHEVCIKINRMLADEYGNY
ncbi:MAG: plasmid mobilization relaxosome protein MobC [Clostridia bacterium]|nr:plasmid mobilization relaxosome protein MobC [Clostridia bacterium]